MRLDLNPLATVMARKQPVKVASTQAIYSIKHTDLLHADDISAALILLSCYLFCCMFTPITEIHSDLLGIW